MATFKSDFPGYQVKYYIFLYAEYLLGKVHVTVDAEH